MKHDIQNCYKKKNTMVYDINKIITKITRTKTTDKVNILMINWKQLCLYHTFIF